MRLSLLASSLLLVPLAACQVEEVENGPGPTSDDDDSSPSEEGGAHPLDANPLNPATDLPDLGDDDTTPPIEPQVARWNFLVFMNGDNNLENLVMKDLNELEQVGSTPGVNVLVQADRAEGYASGDGDWTDARRYLITPDSDTSSITSEVVDPVGEVDMGAPDTVSDFLFWASETYPAERTAFIFWNHGGGWDVTATATVSPFISSDDESGNVLSIAEGEVRDSFQPWVDVYGPLDVVGFDACNMATWEVAHSLRQQALFMVASEATVGSEGYQYAPALTLLAENAEADGQALAEELAWSAHSLSNELTQSAVDLSGMDALAAAVDALAGAFLNDSGALTLLPELRSSSRAADAIWHDFFLDLGDFAAVSANASHAEVAAAGGALEEALGDAVLVTYGNGPYDFAGGLTVFMDTRDIYYMTIYTEGGGATWSQATRWDEMLWAQRELE